jgi:hypothetical protein
MACLILCSLLGLIGCSPRSEPVASPAESPPPSRAEESTAGTSFKQRQVTFLNRIRDADPQHQVINRALLNERNELGLILDRSVELNRIPDLMRSFLTQMAREFPQQDLTVIAYAPSNPPLKVGTARFNSQTRQMSYTPEHP